MEIEPKTETEIKTEHLNPWFSMWTRPRETIQKIIDTNPEHSVIFLAAMTGFARALDQARVKHLGDSLDWTMIFLLAMIAGVIIGILSLFISSALIRWTGSWLNGKATAQEIRAANAWSGVPLIWVLLLWAPKLTLFGQELFTSEAPIISSDPTLIIILFGFVLIQITATIWSLVLFFKCLGQVQGFSVWKAVGNTLLAWIIVLVPIFVIASGITYLVE